MRKIARNIRQLLKNNFVNHQKVFSEIYQNQTWGKGNNKFYSGTGSNDEYGDPYAEVIKDFIRKNNIRSIVDLGCGDFRIGSKIMTDSDCDYIGIDVVSELVAYNNKMFGNEHIKFKHLNIVKNKLPIGQLCLIRQVLQHLSNNDITKVLEKCGQFDYVIITEHQPIAIETVMPNVDKESNAHIRLNANSGVYLDKQPFHRKVLELLTVYPEPEPHSKIVTFQLLPSQE